MENTVENPTLTPEQQIVELATQVNTLTYRARRFENTLDSVREIVKNLADECDLTGNTVAFRVEEFRDIANLLDIDLTQELWLDIRVSARVLVYAPLGMSEYDILNSISVEGFESDDADIEVHEWSIN